MSYDLHVSPADHLRAGDAERATAAIRALRGCEPNNQTFVIQPEEVLIDFALTEGQGPRITLSAALPVISTAGPKSVEAALELARLLGWVVFDPQLDAQIGEADVDRVCAQQRAWQTMAQKVAAEVGSANPPDVTFPAGWVEEDEWWVPPGQSRDDRLRYLNEKRPRRYGWFDQVKVDARAPHSAAGWAAALAALIGGCILQKWYLLVFSGAWFWMFGPTFRRLIRLMRDGEVRILRCSTVQPIPLVKGQGFAELAVGGGKIRVMVPLEATKALIARHGAVEIQALTLEGVEETCLLGIRPVKVS